MNITHKRKSLFPLNTNKVTKDEWIGRLTNLDLLKSPAKTNTPMIPYEPLRPRAVSILVLSNSLPSRSLDQNLHLAALGLTSTTTKLTCQT